MKTITFNEHSFQLPQSWDECNNPQAVSVSGYAMVDTAAMRFLAFKALCPPKLQDHVQHLSAGQAADVLPCMDWLYNSYPTRAIDWEPAQPSRWKWWLPVPEAVYMPTGVGDQMVMVEFTFADDLFRLAHVSDVALARFVAVLCRPQKRHYDPTAHDYDGDRRHRFNSALIDIQAEHLMRHVPARYLCYVYLWFIGFKYALAERYKPLFRVPDENDSKQPEAAPKIPKFGWVGIMFDIADGGAFGTEQEVQYSYIHDVFTYLSKKKYFQQPAQPTEA